MCRARKALAGTPMPFSTPHALPDSDVPVAPCVCRTCRHPAEPSQRPSANEPSRMPTLQTLKPLPACIPSALTIHPGSLQDPAGLGSVRARSRVFGGGTCGGRRGGRSGVRPRPLQHLPGVRAAVSKLCAQATARPRLTHSHAVPHFPTSQSRENRAKYCALRAASPLTGRRTRCEVR